MNLPAGFHLHILHQNRAPYPEISSYKEFFGQWWSVSDGPAAAIPASIPVDRLILWHMMGMYRQRRSSRLTIHDYRSRSIGQLYWLKDYVKKALNARPDLRIFLADSVKSGYGFRDRVPECFVAMGVPSFAFDLSWNPDRTSYDFGYVGMISRDRQFDLLLRRFLDAYVGSRSFLLIGPTDASILDEFGAEAGLHFTGKQPHREALEQVLQARCGVCYIPDKMPFSQQVPTKLLEYAAIGMPILANRTRMNVATIERCDIVATVEGDDLFGERPDPDALASNLATDMTRLDFMTILAESGLVETINKLLGRASSS